MRVKDIKELKWGTKFYWGWSNTPCYKRIRGIKQTCGLGRPVLVTWRYLELQYGESNTPYHWTEDDCDWYK